MKTYFLLLFLFTIRLNSQIEDIPIDLSENPGSYKFDAVTSSLKNAYEPALWLGSFDKYIAIKQEVKSLSQISTGYYRITLNSFCLRPAQPMGSKGQGSLIAPLKGKKAKLIQHVIKQWSSNKQIDQKDVQMLIWGIIAGLEYFDYPEDFRKKIDPLLPADEKKTGFSIKLDDLLDLPLPEEIKAQIRAYEDIKGLIKEGIGRYDDIERIAVPDAPPQPSNKDRDILAGTWTLLENGYYMRAFLGDYKSTPIEVYKPDHVEIIYDSKYRVISMKNSAGMIEIEYDDADGADVITYGGLSYLINRIKSYKLDGVENTTFVDLLWYSPFNSKTSSSSGYKRMLDPPENLFNQRDEQVKSYIDVLKKYCEKKKSKLSENDIEKIYNIKQVEMCFKNLIDMSNVMIGGDEREKFSRIVIDATVELVSSIVPANKLPSGGSSKSSFGFGLMVAVPGEDGAQKVGIPGEDPEDPPRVYLRNIDCTLLPEPGILYSARIEIENNTKPVSEIVFDLFDISMEKGRFMNDKDQMNNTDPDAIFPPSPGYEITQAAVVPNWFIATGNGSSPLTINVRAMDFGTHAKLKARVVIEGVTYSAIADGNGAYLTIPCDANDNHVADSWEVDNDVVGLPANWDEDDYPLHGLRNGDGMTLFEEYRGFYVLQGTLTETHVRPRPKRKEIFVIDNDLILSVDAWQSSSQMPHYKLNSSLVLGTGDMTTDPDYRLVNFCRGYAQGNKYAINLIKVNGLVDPYFGTCGSSTFYFGCSSHGPPVGVNMTVVLPDAIRKYYEEVRDTLMLALVSNPGLDVYDTRFGRYRRDIAERNIRLFNNETKMDLIVDFVSILTAVHEVGHACGIHHHSPEPTDGELECPMIYTYTRHEFSYFSLIFDQTLEALDRGDDFLPIVRIHEFPFCATGDNCMSQINVNDRSP